MELPAEVIIEDILFRLPVNKLIYYWKLLSVDIIRKIARYNDLPLPEVDKPIYDQVLDMVLSDIFTLEEKMELAAYVGDLYTVKRMVELGETNYSSSLMAAALEGHEEVIEYILSQDRTEVYHHEVLRIAAKNGHLEVVDKILAIMNAEARVAYDGTPIEGCVGCDTALVAAAEGGHMEIVDMMVDHGASDYGLALRKAASENHLEIVKRLLSLGVDEHNCGLAAAIAANRGYVEIMEIIPIYSQEYLDELVVTAAASGRAEIVELLIERGAQELDRALRMAAIRGRLEVVDLLLRRGATDYYGALSVAVSAGQVKVAERLLAQGKINPDPYDMRVAEALGNDDMIALLKMHHSVLPF